MARSRLEHWVEKIGQNNLPVFAHTARCMASLSIYDDSSAQELAQVILKDSAMTARLLRMANSLYYNPQGRRIDTVSYGIVLLGFDAVRNMALSITLIDTVLTGRSHDRAMDELVRSVHAGIQAGQFAAISGLSEQEDVFIAAVLHRLGAIAFWCFPDGKDEKLLAAYESMADCEEAERSVLGFTFTELTLALVEDWRLSPMLLEAINNPESKATRCVNAGFGIADNIDQGWSCEPLQRSLVSFADISGLPKKQIEERIISNAELAQDTLAEFGIDSQSLIRLPTEEEEHHVVVSPVELEDQLAIIREITGMLTARTPVNVLLGAVVEGIYRALSMDLVVLAFLDSDRRLKARYALGENREEALSIFSFDTRSRTGGVIDEVLTKKQPILSDDLKSVLFEIEGELGLLSRGYDFMMMPLAIGDNIKAVIYADRHVSGHGIAGKDFDTFQHFCELAGIGMNMLKPG